MRYSIIDAHIHLDLYREQEQREILADDRIAGLITVSQHLASAKKNLALSKKFPAVYPAFGYHPEQPLPTEEEENELFHFIMMHSESMIAVGEVGLPYYLREKQQELHIEPYLALLERFIILAKELHKPIILHAVYDDAPIVCHLLEKHSFKQAHFHWFKGDKKTTERMERNGYFISVTPDVHYEKEIQQLVRTYPLELMMVETDGPWPFTSIFENKMTHPNMIHESIKVIAKLKQLDVKTVSEQLYQNTKKFYLSKLNRGGIWNL